MRKLLYIFLCICISFFDKNVMLHAQDWNIYNSTPQISRIQLFEENVYAISGNSLCYFNADSETNDFVPLNRINGLSGSFVQFIEAIPESQCLAVIYADGNIDLLQSSGKVSYIPDLANKSIAGDKTIYSVNHFGKNLFLSGGFGFIVIDADKQMIKHSYTSKYSISLAFEWNDYLFRYSEAHHLEGGAIADNLSDAANWKNVSSIAFSEVLCFTDNINKYCWLLGRNGKLYELNQQQQVNEISDSGYTHMYLVDDRVILTTNQNKLFIADPAAHTFTPNSDNPFFKGKGFISSNQKNQFFMLLDNNRIYRMEYNSYVPGNHVNFICDWDNTYQAEGIGTNYLGKMLTTENGIVGIARRSYISDYSKASALEGIVSFIPYEEDASIKNITPKQIVSGLSYNAYFQGLTGLAADPLHDQRYAVSTTLHGLYMIDHDTLLSRLDHTNSHGFIEAFSKEFASTRTSAATYDKDGNLFVTCSMQDTILRCLTLDGRVIKYPNPGMAQVADAHRILISQNDPYQLKWVLNDYGYGKSRVGIYYDKASPTSIGTKDYQSTWFSILVDQDNNEYNPNYIYDICEDLDGKIWVLTNLGPFVIESPSVTFDFAQKNAGKGKVRRIKIPRNDGTNLADYLMQNTICTCMAIDKNNQKWIGTNGDGLYLMSDDCITEIEHFTTDNSPLPTNDILDLCYDEQHSQLYISCESAVLTYKTNNVEGEEDLDKIYCYPNPVRPDYYGELNIMGLMDKSIVSITTSSGELVFRTTVHGASVSWNLMNSKGDRVKPGVYMVHAIEPNSKEGKISKVLVL